MFEDQVTVLCRFGPARAEAFSPWVLRGVHWAGADGRRPSPGTGRHRAEGLLVVPYAAAGGYVSPAAWERLSPEERGGHFTLRAGDAVCPGGPLPGEGESPAAFLARTPHWVIEQAAEYPHGPMAHFEALCGGREARL